jgi:serine protease
MILYTYFLQYILCKKYIVISDYTGQNTSKDTIVIGNLAYTLVETYPQSTDIVDLNSEVYVSRYSKQANPPWNLDRIDQRGNDLNANYVYQSYSGTGVWNYVLDTGIYVQDPEFEGRAVWGANFADDQDQNGCMHFHGTYVAGIIGSRSFGVAKNTSLVSVKVLSCSGGGTVWNVLQGIQWVIAQDKKKKVINMSLIGGYNPSLNSAVEQATSLGIVVVVASGNDNANACDFSPSSASTAITTGAFDVRTSVAGFSNWGSCVDIFAPGVDVVSTSPGNQVVTASGTSAAAPHIAGVVSLILDAYRGEVVDVSKISTFLKRASSKGKISGDLKGSPNEIVFSISSFV